MNKYIIPLIGLVFMVMLTAGCTVNLKTDQSLPNLQGRTDNSGLSVRSDGSTIYSEVDSNVADIRCATDKGCDLGTAAVEFGNLFVSTGTISGLVTTTGNLYVSGTLTVDGATTLNGNTAIDANLDMTGTLGNVATVFSIITEPPGAVRNIVAGTGIDATNVGRFDFLYVQGSGGPVTITATPSIAAGANGKQICLYGNSDINTLTLQDESNLAGSKLQNTGGVNVTLGEHDQVCYRYLTAKATWSQSSPYMDN